MWTPVDCDKVFICNVTPRATTIKAIQKETLKNAIDKSKLNLSSPQEGKKKEQKNENTRKQNSSKSTIIVASKQPGAEWLKPVLWSQPVGLHF